MVYCSDYKCRRSIEMDAVSRSQQFWDQKSINSRASVVMAVVPPGDIDISSRGKSPIKFPILRRVARTDPPKGSV